MLLILVKVSVKVACQSTPATDCSHRATSMLLILVQVAVNVACWSTTSTDCSHRAITMELILVEVSVKVATTATELSLCYLFWWKYLWKWLATDCSHRAITMLLILSVKVACRSMTATDCKHRAISMLLILVEVSVKVACRSMRATDCMHHATYSGGSICESGLSAHNNHSLQAQSYLHATSKWIEQIACRMWQYKARTHLYCWLPSKFPRHPNPSRRHYIVIVISLTLSSPVLLTIARL